MRQTKRVFETLSFYDCAGISKRLEKMALDGWMIEKISNYGWVYRRSEPKTVHYSVSFYPRASEFDPEPTEEQQRFIDFCAHTGWKFVCSFAQMQIFKNERENPTPIETEPVLEIESIHASAKKSTIPAYIVILILGFMQGGMWLSRLSRSPIDLLSNTSNLLSGYCWFILFIIVSAELFNYLRWHKNAVPAAEEQGVLLAPPSVAKLQKAAFITVIAVLIVWAVDMLIFDDGIKRYSALIALFYMPAVFGITGGIKAILKKAKASKNVNRAATIIGCSLFVIAFISGVSAVTLKLSDNGFFDVKRAGTYEFNGHSYSLSKNELPLSVEDLIETDFDGYVKERRGSSSLLISKFNMYQYPRFDDNTVGEEIHTLDYSLVSVNVPFFYNSCKEWLISEEENLYKRYEFEREYIYKPVDAEPWRADEAYRLYDANEDYYYNKYLLCYGNSLLEIRFDWELTEDQKTVVGDRFG